MLQDIGFISHCSPSLSTSAPPPTVDNVLTVVQGVHWRRLGEALLTFSSKVDVIGEQHQSDDDRLHAVVGAWFRDCILEEPSWRWLIWTLDESNMTDVADAIRHYAEPVLGKSCDSISVSTFLYSTCISPS